MVSFTARVDGMSEGEIQHLTLNMIHGCSLNPTWIGIAPHIMLGLDRHPFETQKEWIAMVAKLRRIICMECQEFTNTIPERNHGHFSNRVSKTPLSLSTVGKGVASTLFRITQSYQFSKHTKLASTQHALLPAMTGSYPATLT